MKYRNNEKLPGISLCSSELFEVTRATKATEALQGMATVLLPLGASIIDVDSIGEGGGQQKVDYSSKVLVINESMKGGGGSNSHKN